MRILRGLSSRILPCGCFVGIYEQYNGEVVGIVDARGDSCASPAHPPGTVLDLARVPGVSDRPTSAA